MRITKVILEGFNGQTAEYDLEAKHLFVGRRGAGKSTVLSAIDYVLNRVPPNQSWPLHSNPSDESQKVFSATLVLDDGSIIKRETKLTKNGCVGSLWTGPADNPTKMTANAETLTTFPIVISSAESFLSVSNNKKMELLFNLFAKNLNLSENPDTLGNSIAGLEKKIVALAADLRVATIAADQMDTKAREIAGTPDDVAAIEQQFKDHNEKVRVAREELNRLRQEEHEVMTKKRIEEDRIKQEELRKKREEEKQRQQVPVLPPPAAVPLVVHTTVPIVEPPASGQSMLVSPVPQVERVAVPPTIDVVAEINNVVSMAMEKTICHNCNAAQMANPVLIPLKMLAKQIKGARE